MIQFVWQYEVKEQSRGKFELAYGPGGAWSTLFGKAPGYRGTALLRHLEDPRKYLTVDSWDTEEYHQAFLDQHRDEYAAMDAEFKELVDSEVQIGAYRLLAQATVRPSPRPGKGRASHPRRSR